MTDAEFLDLTLAFEVRTSGRIFHNPITLSHHRFPDHTLIDQISNLITGYAFHSSQDELIDTYDLGRNSNGRIDNATNQFINTARFRQP